MQFDRYPAALTLDGTETIVISQGGFTRTVNLQRLVALVVAQSGGQIGGGTGGGGGVTTDYIEAGYLEAGYFT